LSLSDRLFPNSIKNTFCCRRLRKIRRSWSGSHHKSPISVCPYPAEIDSIQWAGKKGGGGYLLDAGASCISRPDHQTGFRLGGETAAAISLPNRPYGLRRVSPVGLTDHRLEGGVSSAGPVNGVQGHIRFDARYSFLW
jgi:hypothetical protein